MSQSVESLTGWERHRLSGELPVFNYESDRPRCWRPDLVPAILAWVESLPESAWADFATFTVEARGGFGAEFDVMPSRGGPRRRIVHRFDHTYHTIENDVGVWRAQGGPTPFDLEQLVTPANTF
jgi:hypothetical protein